MEYSKRFLLLKDLLLKAGAPRFRLQQLVHQLYKGKVSAVSSLKSLGAQSQAVLREQFGPDLLTLKPASISEAPQTQKVLFECRDGARIEAVALWFPSHTSLCISSQVSFFCTH